jgi:hypothetical protein
VEEQSAHYVESAYYDETKNKLPGIRRQKPKVQGFAYAAGSNPVVKIDVFIENDSVVIPCLTGPEPNPAGAANESSNHDQQDLHQESPGKHANSKAALFEGVVTVTQWIRIDVGKHHQAHHDH